MAAFIGFVKKAFEAKETMEAFLGSAKPLSSKEEQFFEGLEKELVEDGSLFFSFMTWVSDCAFRIPSSQNARIGLLRVLVAALEKKFIEWQSQIDCFSSFTDKVKNCESLDALLALQESVRTNFELLSEKNKENPSHVDHFLASLGELQKELHEVRSLMMCEIKENEGLKEKCIKSLKLRIGPENVEDAVLTGEEDLLAQRFLFWIADLTEMWSLFNLNFDKKLPLLIDKQRQVYQQVMSKISQRIPEIVSSEESKIDKESEKQLQAQKAESDKSFSVIKEQQETLDRKKDAERVQFQREEQLRQAQFARDKEDLQRETQLHLSELEQKIHSDHQQFEKDLADVSLHCETDP